MAKPLDAIKTINFQKFYLNTFYYLLNIVFFLAKKDCSIYYLLIYLF